MGPAPVECDAGEEDVEPVDAEGEAVGEGSDDEDDFEALSWRFLLKEPLLRGGLPKRISQDDPDAD